jgi:hypothetical protein
LPYILYQAANCMCRFWGFKGNLETKVPVFRSSLLPLSSTSYQIARCCGNQEEQNVNLPWLGTSNLTSVISTARNVPAFVGSVGEVRDAVETGSPRLALQGHSGLLYSSSYPDMEKCSVHLRTWKTKEAMWNVAARHQHDHWRFSFLLFLTPVSVWTSNYPVRRSYVSFPWDVFI